MNPFDLTPYIYWSLHVKNLDKSKHVKYLKNKFITR